MVLFLFTHQASSGKDGKGRKTTEAGRRRKHGSKPSEELESDGEKKRAINPVVRKKSATTSTKTRESSRNRIRKSSEAGSTGGVLWLQSSKAKLRNALAKLAQGRRKGRIEPDVYVTSTLPVQGQTVAVFVSFAKPRSPIGWLQYSMKQFAHDELVNVSFHGKSIPSYPLRPNKTGRDYPVYRSLIPTTPLDEPGPRTLRIEVQDDRYKPVTIPCTIQKQSFETQHIWLSKKKSTLKKSKTEEAQIKTWQNLQTPEQFWNGPFTVPSTGVISSQYGQQRFYNGKFAKNYYHRGIDYAATTGSPVSSPAAGKVVLVGLEDKGFDLHGNCVGLDHGQGVASMFMHLDKVHVKVGTKVKQGQTLGTIGETGIATGPHLHWGLFVHGQCVDPYMWMNKDNKQHRLLF